MGEGGLYEQADFTNSGDDDKPSVYAAFGFVVA